ncbi:MAG: hypothetical protein ACRDLK_10495, partial [Gaiellaceae bacterium]
PSKGPSAFSQPGGRLAREAGVILGIVGLAALVVWIVWGRHPVHNPRPLGGRNVDITRESGIESQSATAVDPRNPSLVLEAPNDDAVYVSRDGGRTWTKTNGPEGAIQGCTHQDPRVAIDGAGREYLTFLSSSSLCDDNLTPYAVVAERGSATAPWHVSRVAPALWHFGFDDGPTVAVDTRTGVVYAAFERSLSVDRATTVVSRSIDQGRTWSEPVAVSQALDRPHLVSLAVAANGDLYAAGIDAKLGVWVARSTDGGRTFSAPRSAARLAENPAGGCSLAARSPVPHEQERCIGPDPTVLVHGQRVAVVYSDVGDVFVTLLDRRLDRRYHGRINPPDGSKPSDQFMAAAAVDASTGTLWACWYDSRYGGSNNAWYTCSASRDGRRWADPLRASSVPSPPGWLYGDAASNGFRPGLAAGGGTAHPTWIDSRREAMLEDVYTAEIPQRRALGR